jgi:hypothetical protein
MVTYACLANAFPMPGDSLQNTDSEKSARAVRCFNQQSLSRCRGGFICGSCASSAYLQLRDPTHKSLLDEAGWGYIRYHPLRVSEASATGRLDSSFKSALWIWQRGGSRQNLRAHVERSRRKMSLGSDVERMEDRLLLRVVSRALGTRPLCSKLERHDDSESFLLHKCVASHPREGGECLTTSTSLSVTPISITSP